MKLLHTQLQKETAHLPTQLDFYRILYYRGSSYFSKKKKLYKSLQAGAEGEQLVIDKLKEYGRKHWIVLRNMWMNKNGQFESDIILITSHCVYVFEIKNYTGKFTYENGACLINNREIAHNCVQQARRNYVNIKDICSGLISPKRVKGALLFVGEDNDVEMNTDIDYIDVFNRTQLVGFIKRIVEEEEQYLDYPVDVDSLIARFEQYEISNPYAPDPLTLDEMKEVRGGIYCAHCHTFKVKIHRHKVECDCGLIESREEATIRTICDYGVLQFESHLRRNKLVSFLKEQVSINYLTTKIIKKHFIVVENGSHTYYENKMLPYYKICDQFIIKKPKIFHLENNQSVQLNNGQIIIS